MDTITIHDVCQFIIAFAAFLGAISLIISTLKKGKEITIDDVVDKKINEKLKPYKETLDSIDENYKNLSTEISLLIQLNMATVQELQEGKVNGKTTAAMNKLNAYIVDRATEIKA